MMRRFVSLALISIIAALPAACDRTEPEADAVIVNVMTFNIEWGGKHVSFENVVDAIRRSGADVVGIQEAEGNLEELASILGWHFDERTYVISRLPLIDPPAADGRYVYVEVRPGDVVMMANLHLPSDPYGPYLVQDGAPLEEVIETEHATRMPMLTGILDGLATLDNDAPLFVTGDFNSPSHLDWTESMVGARRYLDAAVPWPVSLAMEQAGFRDGWREVYPDVKAFPGLTWWAARPPLPAYTLDDSHPEDRIDMVWSRGPTKARAAKLVGEAGRDGIDIGVRPWPSDHRAVLVTYEVQPMPLPDVLTTDRRVYVEGATPRIFYKLSEAGEIIATDIALSRRILQRPVDAERGFIDLGPLDAGQYAITATVGDTEHVRTIWVLAQDAQPTITADKTQYAAGDPIMVRWQNAPGFRYDYIALFPADNDGDHETSAGWFYIDAVPSGAVELRAALESNGHDLQPGAWVVKLMKDDGYAALAEAGPFTIE